MTRQSPSDDPDVPGAQALVRGLDVLMTIGASPAPMRFGELQKAVGIPKGSLHRLLSALQSRRLVRYEEHGRRYSLGSRVFDLARRTIDQSSIIRAAKPELSRIAHQLGRACCLYVQDGNEVFVLDFEDPDASQARVMRVWPRIAAGDSAAGLALAAKLSPGDEIPPAAEQARALGYALTGGNSPAIASAILDTDGYPIAAICCHHDGNSQGAGDLHEAGRLVREAAQRASINVAIAGQQAAVTAPPETVPPEVTVLSTGRDFMGENPVWCPEENKLWWLDILAPALRCLDYESKSTQRILLDDLTGGLALTASGKQLLAGRRGIHLRDQQTGVSTLLFDPEEDKPENRFNSASLDTSGNLWLGTMPLDSMSGSGSLYSLGPDLSVQVKLPKIDLPKNVSWSQDGKRLFLSEGRKMRLNSYAIRKDGSLGPAKVFLQGNAEIGAPNGIAMDTEGCLWVAMYGGWSVNRYDPKGQLMQKIHLPIPMPTALCFGGPNMDRLFVTSTYLRMPAGYSSVAPQAGNLIEISTGVSGLPSPKFAL